MAKTTITEALSELNLIKKKIASGESLIASILVRPVHVKDQFEKDGGSTKMVNQTKQSIMDLQRRFEKIKSAISQANLDNEIRINETTKTIFDWLTWKRDLGTDYQAWVTRIYQKVRTDLGEIEKNPKVYEDAEGKKQMLVLVPNIDLGDWLRESERLTETLEQLDGQLSLKNATIVIDV